VPVSARGLRKPPLERLQSVTVRPPELLDDFLIALLELPGAAWPNLAVALPDEVFDRVDRYLEGWLAEGLRRRRYAVVGAGK
jgi:hypothetical protein